MELKCCINLFDMFQQGTLSDGTRCSFTFDDLFSETMLNFCLTHQVKKLHLYGPTDYCMGLIPEIVNYSRYNNYEIEVEVN